MIKIQNVLSEYLVSNAVPYPFLVYLSQLMSIVFNFKYSAGPVILFYLEFVLFLVSCSYRFDESLPRSDLSTIFNRLYDVFRFFSSLLRLRPQIRASTLLGSLSE